MAFRGSLCVPARPEGPSDAAHLYVAVELSNLHDMKSRSQAFGWLEDESALMGGARVQPDLAQSVAVEPRHLEHGAAVPACPDQVAPLPGERGCGRCGQLEQQPTVLWKVHGDFEVEATVVGWRSSQQEGQFHRVRGRIR